MLVGAFIRRKRQAMGITQADLAERSGVSKAMICDVEADRKNPTIRLLAQIAGGLQCGISELLDLDEDPSLVVERKGDQMTLIDPETGIVRHALSKGMVKRGIEVLHYIYPAGQDTGSFPAHPPGTTETAYVLEGRIKLGVADQEVELETGDAATYRADVEHSTYALGEVAARVLYVTCIPRVRE